MADPFGGFTGSGIGIIAIVLGFNLFCLLLWFFVTPLRRSHETNVRRVETFLMLLERARAEMGVRDDEEDLDRAVAGLMTLLDKGQEGGPLWGRKHLTSARFGISGMSEAWPDLAGEVNRLMQLGAAQELH
jgi:hypothetical protein